MTGKATKEFGQTVKKGSSSQSTYQRQMGNSTNRTSMSVSGSSDSDDYWERRRAKEAAEKEQKRIKGEALDEKMGYARFDTHGETKSGWLFNILPVTSPTPATGVDRSGVDLYFLSDDSTTFKSTLYYAPYFYVAVPDQTFITDMASFLTRKYESNSITVTPVDKEDLDMPNHLSGKLHRMLKLSFVNQADMMEVRREILPIVKKKIDPTAQDSTANNVTLVGTNNNSSSANTSMLDSTTNLLDHLVDIREYDIPFQQRVMIDLEIRAGQYYTVTPQVDKNVVVTKLDKTAKPSPRIMAFDIECTKAPLKFPDAEHDQIFMISYMVDGQGYLIISRDIVSQDINDFEYTPKPSFPGPFKIFNEKTEADLIRRFFDHVEQLKPQIMVTYNGDYFDWPFLEKRAEKISINMAEKIGIERTESGGSSGEGEYRGRGCVHLDAFAWVKRDSYLPQGAQGLKAVTKYKLGYDPVEVDPEDMVKYASGDQAFHMASYSVSDAVATYYLYDQYVHLFIFSLCTLIPLGPEDVLRKGSGTLCETLLMVEAYRGNIVCPNKHIDPLAQFHNGHLLESETYIGGHVECLETGVYRSDIPCKFNLVPSALQGLIDNVDRDLTFFIEVESGIERASVANYDEIRAEIVEALELLRDCPDREEEPYIYHLDVGAMYPNIILTNRLQPGAIVDEATCASCDFNQAENGCKRKMEWTWRGDTAPANMSEYNQLSKQIASETIGGKHFLDYDQKEQAKHVAKRVKDYSHKVYKASKETTVEDREDTVCMRENPFYVNTVKNFRDRRYDYKKMTKKWKGDAKKAEKAGDSLALKHANDMSLVYDSLQVAHKCILNSFYGYVMRKGARWRSMEMAGIVTLTGARLITQARELVEQIGRPLELDTDGIWCILPKSFPDVFHFKLKGGGKQTIEYPCCMLNSDVHDRYTNHQYQELADEKTRAYTTRSECSIFFEVDGPYKAMILPSSTEEGKLLKKRYAVFNMDNTLAELKGFELKRRGELELIKAFQGEIFEHFLDGTNLVECYDSVGQIANHWLDVLDGCGDSLTDEELVGLISENRSMSRQLEDYGDQKSTSLTTAKRLGEFLGKEMTADKGLNCKFIISEKPHGAPVTERAIPCAIWLAEPAVMKLYLRKWMKDSSLEDFDMRTILDWDYYRERLSKTIQKIITIPAALQRVAENPVPRVEHPDWLKKVVRMQNDKFKQKDISSMFTRLDKGEKATFGGRRDGDNDVMDIEDFGKPASAVVVKSRKGRLPASGVSTPVTPEPSSAKRISLTSAKEQDRGTFDKWLKQRKSLWKNKRKERKREATASLLNDFQGGVSNKRRKVGVEGFLKNAARSLSHGEWQIIEVRQTDTAGEFILFVMVDGTSIQKLQLSVPRKILLNLVEKSSTAVKMSTSSKAKKVNDWSLPHNKQCKELYELTVEEREYLEQRENLLVNSAGGIDSMYETQTPLGLDALVKLGNVARVTVSKRDTVGKSTKFALGDLEKVNKPGVVYLHNSVSKCKRIFMLHRCPTSSRGVVALFFMEGAGDSGEVDNVEENSVSLTAHCVMWVVKPSLNKQHDVSTKFCEKTFKDFLAGLKSGNFELDEEDRKAYGSLKSDSTCSFELSFVGSETEGLRLSGERLNRYVGEKNGPTVLVVKSLKSLSEIRGRVGGGFSQLPAVKINDGVEESSNLRFVQWEKNAVVGAMMSYLKMCAFEWRKKLQTSRFCKVPLGNLGEKEEVFLYDVLYSRKLRENRHLLWASDGDKPDLGTGGKVEEGEEEIMPEVVCPGSYRNFTFELEIKGLAVACMRCLDVGGGGGMGEGGEGLGDEAAVGRAFNALQTLVGEWYRQARAYENDCADGLLRDLYRQVCDSDSLLYDPAIKRVLVGLMHRGFSMLVAELEKLGAKVVYGDFFRVIISCNKVELGPALEYVNFLMKCLDGGVSVVGEIQLKMVRVWSDLLFLNADNFEGVEFDRVDGLGEGMDEENEENEGGEREITVGGEVWRWANRSNWNIKNFLGAGESGKMYFSGMAGRFSRSVYQKRMGLLKVGGGVGVAERGDVKEKEREFKRKYVSKQLSTAMTKYVGEIMANGGEGEEEREKMGKLPGARAGGGGEVLGLEFVRQMCKVFELDEDVMSEVQTMKKSLLTQLGMHEYSVEAAWREPCRQFVLPNLFCDTCGMGRNLNLCSVGGGKGGLGEEGEEGEGGEGGEEGGEKCWFCFECGGEYDKQKIEERLVGIMESKSVKFNSQDLRDGKNNKVCRGFLEEYGEGGNEWVEDVGKEQWQEEIEVVGKLAEYYQMDYLAEVAERLAW